MDTTYQIAGKVQSSNVHRRHQTVCKKWKRIGNPNTDSENIQLGHRNGIWHGKMCHANNEKQEMTHDGRDRPTKPRKNLYTWGKGNIQILGNMKSWHHQTSTDERKN